MNRRLMLLLSLLAFATTPVVCTAEPAHGVPAPSGSTVALPTPYPPRPGSSLTPGQEKRGWDIVVNACLSCHTAELLSQQRLSAKQWQASITKMHKWGALVYESEEPELTTYLADHFTTGMPVAQVPTISYKEAVGVLKPLNDGPYADGDRHKGKEIYTANCASCHAENGRGATATNLVDRTSLWRAPEFAKVVREGRGRMMAYGDMFSDKQIGSMIAYLRSAPPVQTSGTLAESRKAPAGN